MRRPKTRPGRFRRLAAWAGLLCLVSFSPAQATIFFIADSPFPFALLRVGSPAAIDAVTFDIPAAVVGNGTPVAGNQQETILLFARFPSPANLAITANSSVPLTDGGNTIPFSQISWVSRDGNVPAGTFNGSVNQPIFTFNRSLFLVDRLRFSYANTVIPQAGVYQGRVVYTLTLP